MLLACTLALTALPCVAAAGVRPGVEGGWHHGKLTREDDPFDLPAPRLRPAWVLGATAEVPAGTHTRLVPAVRYQEIGDVLELRASIPDNQGGSFVIAARSHTVLRYLSVPLRIEMAPFPSRRWTIEAGPDPQFLLQAVAIGSSSVTHVSGQPRRAQPAAQIFEQVGTFDHRDATGLYHRWNLVLSAGAGVDMAARGHVVTLRLRYDHGVTNVQDAELPFRRYTRSAELTGGVRW
jgi:outer membrane protein with beta-barrel domain